MVIGDGCNLYKQRCIQRQIPYLGQTKLNHIIFMIPSASITIVKITSTTFFIINKNTRKTN